MNKLCTIYLVRHGESEGNINFGKWLNEVQKTKLGSNLTVTGRRQALLLADKLKHIRFDAIFSSHLNRAKQTAEIIAKEYKKEVIVKETLEERRKGNLGGKNEAELRKVLDIGSIFNYPEHLTADEIWKWKLFPDMESAEEASRRFITTLKEIATMYRGKNVLITSHGFVMRAFLVPFGVGTFRELSSGAIINTGYVILESDGVDFFVKETSGVEKKIPE
jgi:broad specificity phosphatase PhoE